jgi:ankyrin repeat protein
VQHGANANASDPAQDGKTVLMIACEKGFLEVIDCLLEQDDCQINYKDQRNRTPILHALEAQAENEDIIVHLIKKSADINFCSFDGWSPMLKATHKGFHRIMRQLL